MVNLIVNLHLPLVRIAQEKIPFLGGTLWQMPFTTFDDLTSGAFTDHKKAYEGTKPVFFNIELPQEDPPWLNDTYDGPSTVMELKVATSEKGYKNELSNSYPFWLFHYIQDVVGNAVWQSLLLAAPKTQMVQPRHSITFVNADNVANYFKIGKEMLTSMANYRGDADLEYLLMPEAAGPELDDDILETASACFRLLKTINENPELSKAMSALKTTCLPYLSAREKFTFGITALENLLIPDVYRDISETFASRMAAFLSSSPETYKEFKVLGKELYKIRSRDIHGKRTKRNIDSLGFEGQHLLASSILALAQEMEQGKILNDLMEAADMKKPINETDNHKLIPAGISNASTHILLKKKFTTSGTYASNTKTAFRDKKELLVSWSPLIGLHISEEVRFEDMPVVLTPMNGQDLVSLEDKDIRRDFISNLRVDIKEVAVIGVGMHQQGEALFMANFEPNKLYHINYTRNLITIALRICGFKEFTDPELLGHYFYQGNMRSRQASVLRQSIYMKINSGKGEIMGTKDVGRVSETVKLLQDYALNATSLEIDFILNLYRRMHESQYLPLTSRATIGFVLLEKMLGPFRSKEDPVQLEALVSGLMRTDDSVVAFEKYGRKFRNSLAHGYWDPAKEGGYFGWLSKIVDATLPAFVKSWLNEANREGLNPKKAFVNSILANAKQI